MNDLPVDVTGNEIAAPPRGMIGTGSTGGCWGGGGIAKLQKTAASSKGTAEQQERRARPGDQASREV